MEKYILAIGEILIDAITDTNVSDLSQAKGLKIYPGGSTANFCRYLKKCNTESMLVAAVGSDGFGNLLLENIQSAGLNTTYIIQQSEHYTSLIAVGKSAYTPDFIPYRGADRFISDIDPDLISNASIVHSTAFSLSLDPARNTILKAFEAAGKNNIPVSVDWNYSEEIWGEKNDSEKIFHKIQQYSPLLKLSMDDTARFLGKEISIEDAKEFIQTIQTRAVCLTCGSLGVFYKDSSGPWQHLSTRKIDVKDATVAGDAFWAGFISAWTIQSALEDCVITGIETATKKLSGIL
jgi:sugar/nucleoside kinase (ribokinase family)